MRREPRARADPLLARMLERAVEVPGLYVKLHPLFDSLRSEPRFDAILAGMNLAD